MHTLQNLAVHVTELQNNYTVVWHSDLNAQLPIETFDLLVLNQHKQNFDLWHEEDKARDPSATDQVISQVKRSIDALNQRRNDLITEVDLYLANHELAQYQNNNLPWNSETIGSIVDRLSIASLKVFHMDKQTTRENTTAEHRQLCGQKLDQLRAQQQDLSQALQVFIDDIISGHKQNKLYRQFKMYNDPNLNPQIYANKS